MIERDTSVERDTKETQALRIDNAVSQPSDESLTVEAPLHIRVNGVAFTTTMRTPGDDEVLARGLLFTEGITPEPRCELTFATVDDPETGLVAAMEVGVSTDDIGADVADRKSLLSSSSCGMCGTKEPRDIELFGPPIRLNPAAQVSVDDLRAMMAHMRDAQRNFTQTGGCHAAAVFGSDVQPIAVFEDIGRHNAVDKCIGHLLHNRTLDQARVLTVSGRLSYEIVFKAYKAGVPVLCAVSAPSSMAVETADRMGQTLIAFCRDTRMTVYAHPERIDRVTPGDAQ